MKPTDFLGEKVEYDVKAGCIHCINKNNTQILLVQVSEYDLDGDNIGPQSEIFEDELKQWIADAINEKLERERFFGNTDSKTTIDLADKNARWNYKV